MSEAWSASQQEQSSASAQASDASDLYSKRAIVPRRPYGNLLRDACLHNDDDDAARCGAAAESKMFSIPACSGKPSAPAK